MISISEKDLARLLQENVRLSEQVTELQASGTALVTEMRRLSKHEIDLPVKRVSFVGPEQVYSESPLPRYHTEGSVGLDLHTSHAAWLPAGARKKLPTGISIQLPPGCMAVVLPRSGMSERDGLVAITGLIDSDYRGAISILVHNISANPHNIEAGARIAQLVILPVVRARLVEVKELDVTARGDKGFGSTGT